MSKKVFTSMEEVTREFFPKTQKKVDKLGEWLGEHPKPWEPSTNLNHAFLLVEKIKRDALKPEPFPCEFNRYGHLAGWFKGLRLESMTAIGLAHAIVDEMYDMLFGWEGT
jgi:hypothetical protein